MKSLWSSMLHQILAKVGTNSVRDHGAKRIAFRGFNEVGREDHFYRTSNLLFLNNWICEFSVVRTFRLRCQQVGNPEAIYLRGMYEFFMLHLLEEGRVKIRLASERGCELAIYVNAMMDLAFIVDEKGRVHIYPSFTRDHVDRMSNMITRWDLGGHWDYKKSAKFLEIVEKIDANTCFDFPCFREEPGWVERLDGTTTMWRCDRCFWQYEACNFCVDIHLCAHEWPIED